MNIEHKKLIAAATKNNLIDADYDVETWMVDAVETQETIENFLDASRSYAERTRAKLGTIAGFDFVAFSEVQLRKGQPRRSLSVIDFGDYRVALDVDLTVFDVAVRL